jgi:hypothetical protein
MQELIVIDNITIRQDAQGRYCLNDLHRAAGGEEKHSPNRFMRTDSCKSLIKLLTPKMASAPIEVNNGGNNQGTFVVKQLVYAYAMWISPEFHLKVIETFDAVVTGKLAPPAVDPLRLLDDPATLKTLLLANIQQNEEQKLLIEQRDKMISNLAPKAEVTERLMGAEGNMCIRDAARALKMKQNRFTHWLQEKKIAYRDKKGKLAGYSEHVPRFVDHKPHTIHVDGEPPRVDLQMMVTPAGLVKFARMLNVDLYEQDLFAEAA